MEQVAECLRPKVVHQIDSVSLIIVGLVSL